MAFAMISTRARERGKKCSSASSERVKMIGVQQRNGYGSPFPLIIGEQVMPAWK
jgi:hypothetical protein